MVDSNDNQKWVIQLMYRFCSANEKMKTGCNGEANIHFQEYALRSIKVYKALL